MKVLQVNCVYNHGSTGKITHDIHVNLKRMGIDSVVCYGRGNLVKEENVYKVSNELYSKFNNLFSRFTGILYGGCFFSTNRLISIIKKEKPDVVHLHCINGFFVNIYSLLSWLKKNNIKTVLTLHAEFMYTGGCSHAIDCNYWCGKDGCKTNKCPQWSKYKIGQTNYNAGKMWRLMFDSFDGFDKLIVVSVSPWLMRRAKSSTILSDKKHCVVLNGINSDIFHYYNSSELKKLHGFNSQKIIFHVTPFLSANHNHIKGGRYVIELAKQLQNENVIVVVAGNYDEKIDLPSNMVMLGMIDDQKQLAKYYSMADVTVLTSKRETFSMVVAESLCCGTPVVGFKAGGPEQIAIDEYSFFCDFGDVETLKNHVMEFCEKKNSLIADMNKVAEKYSINSMVNNYLNVYFNNFR